jgi:hypothetical protein
MRSRFVDSLDEEQKRIGEKALSFRDGWLSAHTLYHEEGRYREAFAEFRSLWREHPEIARSPLVRPKLLSSLLKSGAGSLPASSSILRLGRAVNARIRHLLGRYPVMGTAQDIQNEDEKGT